jgi:hypothetical protein
MSATHPASLTVQVPLRIRRRPGRNTVVSPDGGSPMPARTRGEPALVKALARAFRWRAMLDDGRFASITELAAAERIERGYAGQILRLTLLAPDIVEAALNGSVPDQPIRLSTCGSVPPSWDDQRARASGSPR